MEHKPKLIELTENLVDIKITGFVLVREGKLLVSYSAEGLTDKGFEIKYEGIDLKLTYESEHEISGKKAEALKEFIIAFINSRANIYPGDLTSSINIIDIVTTSKSVDQFLPEIVKALTKPDRFDYAAVLLFNEALMELRGVIYAYRSNEKKVFKNSFMTFKIPMYEKDDLSDIMFFNRTKVVDLSKVESNVPITDYFDGPVLATCIGRGIKPIGVILAGKKNYCKNDIELLDLYGSITFLAIEYIKVLKDFDLSSQKLKNLKEEIVYTNALTKMGRLSATVAHELKNPLVAIGGFARKLSERTGNDQLGGYAKMIVSEVVKLESIVTDILEYSKKMVMSPEYINARTLVEEVVHLLEEKIEHSGKKTQINIYDEFDIYVDINRFRQVLINIIDNGLQATPEYGTLYINADASIDSVIISIADTGGGISQENLEKIFEPFYTTKAKGTGLGLPLSKKIMNAHGGDLVACNYEKGAVFSIILPVPGERK